MRGKTSKSAVLAILIMALMLSFGACSILRSMPEPPAETGDAPQSSRPASPSPEAAASPSPEISASPSPEAPATDSPAPADPTSSPTPDSWLSAAEKERFSQYLSMFNGIAPFSDPDRIEKGALVSMLAYSSGVDLDTLTEPERQSLAAWGYEYFAPLSSIEEAARRLVSPGLTLPTDYDYAGSVVMGYGDGWVEELQGVGWTGHGLGASWNAAVVLSATRSGRQYLVDVVEVTLVADDEYLATHGVLYQGGREVGSADRDDPDEEEFTYSFSVPPENLSGYRYVLEPYAANEGFGLQVISKTAR